MKNIYYLTLFLLVLSGCNNLEDYNAFSYRFNENHKHVRSDAKILVASLFSSEEINSEDQKFIQNELEQRLGLKHEITPKNEFNRIYQRYSDDSPGFFDSKTGKLDNERMNAVVAKTINEVFQSGSADYICIPYLIFQVTSSKGGGRYFYWDGVKRELDVEWNAFGHFTDLVTSSLAIQVFHRLDGEVLYNKAGIDLMQEQFSDETKLRLRMKKSPFSNKHLIKQAVIASCHPFIDKAIQ